jgi:hypothetical protein
MGFDKESKCKVIETMQAIYRNGQMLEMELRFSDRKEEAEDVWRKNVRLSHEIDILIGKAIDDWLGDASAVVKRLEKARGQLQSGIDEIGAAINSTDKAIKVIGAFDDALGTVMKVLKAL